MPGLMDKILGAEAADLLDANINFGLAIDDDSFDTEQQIFVDRHIDVFIQSICDRPACITGRKGHNSKAIGRVVRNDQKVVPQVMARTPSEPKRPPDDGSATVVRWR